MADGPTISILIPAYNAAATLAESVECAIGQSWPHLEIIVVDDGSTDATAEVAQRYAGAGVRLLLQQNAGASAARNRAFAASTGDYVLFLDADDLIGPDHVAAMARAAAAEPGTVGMAEWVRFRGGPGTRPYGIEGPRRRTYADASGVEWLMVSWSDGLPMTQSAMFLVPRDLIERHGGWDERLSVNDDFEFFCRILTASAGVRIAPGARVYYRNGGGGHLSERSGETSNASTLQAMLMGTDALLAAEDSARTRQAAANILRGFDWNYYPSAPHLRAIARRRAAALGGANATPLGPPLFHRLRPLFGWRLARHIEHAVDRIAARRAARIAAPTAAAEPVATPVALP